MLDIKIGNIFECEEDIIAHQVNCLGIMGGGIALQIKKLYPNVFDEYYNYCIRRKKEREKLLGNLLICNDDKIIANCFGQLDISKRKCVTNYEMLEKSLTTLRMYAHINNLSIAIPYKIGCGLAGGDWNIVYNILKELFEKSCVKCVLYKFEG